MRDGGIDFGTASSKKKEDASKSKKDEPKAAASKKEPPKKEVVKPKAEKAVKSELADAGVSQVRSLGMPTAR